MAEKKTVKLAAIPIESPDSSKCIICQKSSSQSASGTENGCKRICEAALIRNDVVSKRLKLIGDNDFVYHMSNECYKRYTLKKTLARFMSKDATKNYSADHCPDSTPRHLVRSNVTPQSNPTSQCDVYKQTCIVCGCVKHQGIYEKHRISESGRAEKFLEATVFLKDDVYTRTCDLQDINLLFGADLLCHKICINRYLLPYERACTNKCGSDSVSLKEKAWSSIIEDIKTGLSNGEGYELSFVRDSKYKYLESENNVTNYFGDRICFSQPKQANRSVMFFSKNVTAEHMADTIRCTDPIKQCAELIRQSLLDTDFHLQDRFCDANDLKTSWDTVPIPEPLMNFFAALYNFDENEFNGCKRGPSMVEDENYAPVYEQTSVSESRC